MASVLDAIASAANTLEAATDLGLIGGNIIGDIASDNTPASLENKELGVSQIDSKIMMGKDLKREFDQNQEKLIQLAEALKPLVHDLQARKLPPEKVKEFGDKFQLAKLLLARNQMIMTHCQRMLKQ